MLLPSMSNAFEASVLSLSLIVLSVGYSLEWNTDRRLAEEKWRFILDNGFVSSRFSRLPVCPSESLSHTHTHTYPPLVSHKHVQGSWQSVQSFPLAGLYTALWGLITSDRGLYPVEQMTEHKEPPFLHLSKQEALMWKPPNSLQVKC